MQRNLAKKIQAKQESGLTAVRLKQDPTFYMMSLILTLCLTTIANSSTAMTKNTW